MNTQPNLKFDSKSCPGSVLVKKLNSKNQYKLIGAVTRLKDTAPLQAKGIDCKVGDRVFFAIPIISEPNEPFTPFLIDPTYEGLKKKLVDFHAIYNAGKLS